MADAQPARRTPASPVVTSDEHELLSRIQRGDQGAFEQLFHAYYQRLVGYVLGYVSSVETAEELVQDLFLRLWEQRERWVVRDGVARYLYAAARNHALTQRKHQRVVSRWAERAGDDLSISGMGAGVESAEDRLQSKELDAALRRALDALPPRRREALTLRWQHRLSNAQVAQVMGVSVKCVELQVMRALRTLRKDLSRFF